MFRTKIVPITMAAVIAVGSTLGVAYAANNKRGGENEGTQVTTVKLAQRTSPTPSKEGSRYGNLADAASINEDLIGFSLKGNADKVAEKVAAMREALPTLRPLLNASSFDTLRGQLTEMEHASAKSDVFGTALAAVEAYRVIENAMGSAVRPSPIEVAMLDYSGFKLSILATAPDTDWAMITATAKDSDGSWSVLNKSVKQTSIRNLVNAIQDGLRGAVERKDIHSVQFAAKMQLEVVDVLEQYFMSGPKSGGIVHR
jgi:hypothetical protein